MPLTEQQINSILGSVRNLIEKHFGVSRPVATAIAQELSPEDQQAIHSRQADSEADQFTCAIVGCREFERTEVEAIAIINALPDGMRDTLPAEVQALAERLVPTE